MPTDPLTNFSDNRGTVIRLLLETDVNLDGPKPEDFKRLITLVVSTVHDKMKDFAPTTRVTVIEPKE